MVEKGRQYGPLDRKAPKGFVGREGPTGSTVPDQSRNLRVQMEARDQDRRSSRRVLLIRPRGEVAASSSRASTSSVDTVGTPRHGLAFILNDAPALTPSAETIEFAWSTSLPQRRSRQQTPPPRDLDPRMSQRPPQQTAFVVDDSQEKEYWTYGVTADDDEEKRGSLEVEADGKTEAQPRTPTTVTPAPLSREEKRRGRTCRVDGCDNYIVHKGLCCRHGGARRCSTEGCESTAKYMGLCWKHGGSTWCKVEGCSKRAKAKGRCWAHGGGTQCSHPSCTKVAVSNGLCWAHGGGKRCLFDGCNRPGYERTNGFCDRHFDELQGVDYFEV